MDQPPTLFFPFPVFSTHEGLGADSPQFSRDQLSFPNFRSQIYAPSFAPPVPFFFPALALGLFIFAVAGIATRGNPSPLTNLLTAGSDGRISGPRFEELVAPE